MSLSRRAAVGLGLAAGACATGEFAEGPPGLNAIAQTKGMRFGSAMGAMGQANEFADPRYRELVRGQCGVLVAQNEHKWPYVEPTPGEVTFAAGDSNGGGAGQNGIAFRGHNLVWHHPNWLPRWLSEYDFGAQPARGAEALLRRHITTVCAHYRDVISSWDVINE